MWRSLAFAAGVACVAALPAMAQPHPNYYRMKKVNILDQQGFERPIPSASLLLPTDWQFQGQTAWVQGGGCDMVQTSFKATSADGKLAIEAFPEHNWQWADDPNMQRSMMVTNQQKAQYRMGGCEVMAPMGAADFLKRNFAKVRPNARLAGVEPIADVAQSAQEQARQAEAMAARVGIRMRVRPDVARIRLQYNVNGQPVEEWITAVTITRATLGPNFNMATGQLGQAFSYHCAASMLFALRAPQGQLDASEKFFRLILGSIRVDPTWLSRVTQVSQNIQAAELKGARDRSAIITKNGQDINKIITEGYDARQKTQDATAQNFSQMTRGVETWRNQSTGETVELSNQYGRAWTNNRGEYLLSDQPGFDPNVTLRESWTALQRVKP